MDKRLRNIIIALVVVVLFIISLESTNTIRPWSRPRTYESSEIIEIMENHLYEKYGEEFVVDRLGTRTARDTTFYQARIYPKSIIGTSKEGDPYYQATVNIDILESGELRDPGDTYSRVRMRETAKEYLRPKVTEIFGERVRINLSQGCG